MRIALSVALIITLAVFLEGARPSTIPVYSGETQKIVLAIPSVVLVQTEFSQGTAFCVSSIGIFATAGHVVTDPKGQLLKTCRLIANSGTSNQRVYQAEPILLSETADIALILLKGPVPDLYPIRLGTKVPDLLTPVLVIGYPEATRMDAKPLVTLSPGVVGSLRYIEEYLDCIQIDVHASPGSSGSPVLDRETGELLGIISKGLLNGGMFFAVPCEELASLLKTVGIPG